MPEMTEDQRIVLAKMHALALKTLEADDAYEQREYLKYVAELSPEVPPLADDDPRSDAVLGMGLSSAPASRQLAASIRGVALGAGIHRDTVAREVGLLAREVVGELLTATETQRRAVAAMEAVRNDLVYDVVQLGLIPSLPRVKAKRGDWVRRWGVMRTLELNAFVATFTRDGTHPAATKATRDGKDGAAFRFAMAVASASMSLAHDAEVNPALVQDIQLVEKSIRALLANLIRKGRAVG